jgi:hypothetical protein
MRQAVLIAMVVCGGTATSIENGGTAATSIENMLADINEKVAKLHADNTVMKAQIVDMKAKELQREARLNSTTLGELKLFVDGRNECPTGYIEANIAGRVVVARPKGGVTGAQYNRPFDAGEVGRTPVHSHTVTVNDPGHTHVGIVNDPGHGK